MTLPLEILGVYEAFITQICAWRARLQFWNRQQLPRLWLHQPWSRQRSSGLQEREGYDQRRHIEKCGKQISFALEPRNVVVCVCDCFPRKTVNRGILLIRPLPNLSLALTANRHPMGVNTVAAAVEQHWGSAVELYSNYLRMARTSCKKSGHQCRASKWKDKRMPYKEKRKKEKERWSRKKWHREKENEKEAKNIQHQGFAGRHRPNY